ncbi:hypothetical protein HPP92_027316 [Vanilla planifolia]|uniref:Uncharacterized protein n=1 Tax=Vanilla planifolia TaxID=51239 RepID=A0A835PFR2_VANPL|nr:hypothetical protein HPP92_027316 [Vanilla planifolia]
MVAPKISKPFKAVKKAQVKSRSKLNGVLNKLPSSIIQDDEPEFPRGGRNLLSMKEEANARAEAEAEFEKDQRLKSRLKNTLKKRKMKKVRGEGFGAGEDEWGSLFDAGVRGKLARLANRITWKA